ncbi:MAG: 4Fe-4S binding protein [Clostridia bacterium]
MDQLKPEDIARVKGMGFLRNRGTDLFSGRVVAHGTVFTAAELSVIAQISEQFGNGKVAFSTRMTAEIVGIAYDQIDAARAYLRAHTRLDFGGTGARVRPIVACKGTTCVYGNCDTQKIASDMHDAFYLGMADIKLGHKFKIAVGGCPNSCVKPSLNDFSVEGHRAPKVDLSKCRGCKTCQVETRCPSRAARVEQGKLAIDPTKCVTCGVCVGKCPFGAVAPESDCTFFVYVGGTWGKSKRVGTLLSRTYAEAELVPLCEKCLLWFRENGLAKERFGVAIDRVGFDQFEMALNAT